MKYIVAYSGGHSSARVAVEAVRKHGKENVILLNHNISPKAEHEDVKRFKKEVADYLGMEITPANMKDWETMDPVDVCVKAGAWKVGKGPILCTYYMKTEPFYRWLKENIEGSKEEFTILYGFDADEISRMNRRAAIMGADGYKVDFPLATWDLTFYNIEELGIKRPEQYKAFNHANCIPCNKAGKQHLYLVYCVSPEKIDKIAWAEKPEQIGYSLKSDIWMDELIELFKLMQAAGVQPTEKMPFQTFWATSREKVTNYSKGQMCLFDEELKMPCDCSF